MKIKNFIITAVTAVVMMLSLHIFAYADGPVNGISVSDSSPERGSEFTLTLYAPPCDDADTASIHVEFDPGVFEVSEWAPVMSGSLSNAVDGMIALSAANAERYIDLSKGLELTARIKVRDDAPDGVYSFELTDASLCYFNEAVFDFTELWQPEITKVSVTVGSGMASAADDDAPVSSGSLANSSAPADKPQSSFPVMYIVIGVFAAAVIVVVILALRKRK